MDRFFFDLQNGDCSSVDQEGCEFVSVEAACRSAWEALPLLASDIPPFVGERQISVLVRDTSGRYLYRASFTLESDWPGPSVLS